MAVEHLHQARRKAKQMSQPIFKPRTFNGDLAHLPNALTPLTSLRHWVVWRWQSRTSKSGVVKWTKPPYQIASPNRLAKANQASTWGRYEDSYPIVEAETAHGIGFQVSGSYMLAVDLDRIRDAMTGEFTPRGKELIAETAKIIGLYREVTVSGTGVRFIGLSNNAAAVHRKFSLDPATGEAIELYRNCERYITISGFVADLPTCPVLAPRDDYFDKLLARFDSGGSGNSAPVSFDFNDAGPQPQIDYRDLIQNGADEGERSEEFARVVWYLASQGKSTEEIAAELAQHPSGIGEKYAGRLQAEVNRSYAKWQTHRRVAAGGGPAAGGAPWPQIQIIPGEIPRIVNEAENALLLLDREIYQRGGLVVRPVLARLKASKQREIQGWQLVPVTRPYLVDALTCAAQFMRYNTRSKTWVTTDAPDKVAEIYLARRGRWKLPVLTGIIHTPFLRTDGSICELPGYDVASGLLFKPDDQNFPPIPQSPSKADAIAALAQLEHLISTFPFVAAADRSVALSAILTTLDRRSMATAPLHAFSSPTPGTGKSLLVDVAAVLATGRPMPVIAQGRNEEELEKRLGAVLLAGDTAISLDNCDHVLEGSFLCQVLTQQQLNIRILGQSRNAETPVNATLFATGNNLTIGGDLIRRSLLCMMDAGCERPELRVFNVNAVEATKANRGELVVAALTILRAWHLTSDAGKRLPPFGSFEEWSQRIREPLVWLDRIDPCETLVEIRKNDPDRDLLIAVIMQWKEHLSIGTKYTVQEVIERAINVSSFYTALMNVAGARTGGTVSNERLGRWLKRVQRKIVNNLMLLQDGINSGYPVWKLIQR
jgi:hypothetical protein